jgi:hypothetical protein
VEVIQPAKQLPSYPNAASLPSVVGDCTAPPRLCEKPIPVMTEKNSCRAVFGVNRGLRAKSHLA